MKAQHRMLLGAGAASAYAFYEPYRYRLAFARVPVRPGTPSLSILHISDTHLQAKDERRAAWVKSIPQRLGSLPDLVLATGDFIEDNSGVSTAVSVLNALEARLGRYYVLGSHDYYVSRFRLPTSYFAKHHTPIKAQRADTLALETGLREKGWTPLTNSAHVIDSPAGPVRVAGVDDPYLNRHSTDHIKRDPGDVAAIALVHAPDVVSEWILADFDLVLGGHTHGGQVRVPGMGALVTNCDLPTQLASGLRRIGHGWLHVSPGLGTGRFTPIRFACRPEATLLQLVPG